MNKMFPQAREMMGRADATEYIGEDACAATRRAIVRAAAAMAEKTR